MTPYVHNTDTYTHKLLQNTMTCADYSRMFMKMACEYLEGCGRFSSTDGKSNGAVVDPRVCV
jgi:hypothetical protein